MRKNLLWYIRLFAALSICVLLFFMVQLYAYNQFSTQLRNEIVQKQMVYINRGAAAVEDQFNNYRSVQLTAVQNISRLAKVHSEATLHKTDFAHLIKIKEELNNILGVRTEKTPFLLVMTKGKGFAVSHKSIYHDLEQSVRMHTLYFDGMSYPELLHFLKENASIKDLMKHAQVFPIAFGQGINAQDNAVPTFSVVIRLGSANVNSNTYAIWMYQIPDLRESIANTGDMDEFFALFFGDELLYTSDDTIDLAAEKASTVYDAERGITYLRVQMPTMGLTAWLALKDSVILSSLHSFSVLRGVLLVSFAVLAAVLALLLLFYLIRPLNRLYSRVAKVAVDGTQQGNVFAQLERHLDALSTDRQELEQKAEHWNALLHKSLLVRLLQGEVLPPSSQEVLTSIEKTLEGHSFRVILIGCIHSAGNALAEVRPDFEAYMKACGFTLYAWINEERVALVLPDDYQPAGVDRSAAVQNYLENFCEILSQRLQLTQNLTFAVGLEHAEIRNLKNSFKEAVKAFHEAQRWNRSGVVYYEVYSAGQALYSLSYDELSRLQNILMAGDAKEAGSYLDTLAARLVGGFSSHPLEEWLLSQFADEIRGVVLRVSVKFHEQSILDSFPASIEPVNLSVWLTEAHSSFRYICQVVQSTHSGERQLSDELLDYISRYYNDSALSLITLAEAFGMSERSLSRYFKDKMQDTFSNILEKYRLREAEKILLGGTDTLRIVAEKVGYSNASTFLKAFKRRHGVTPSEWIQQAGSENASVKAEEN